MEPIQALEHEYGKLALQFLIAGLCVTPIRRFVGLNLLKFRRLLGVVAFVYVALHLLVWLLLDVQVFSHIVRDIVKRPYIAVGLLAFVVLLPLAATSNNLSIRWLGAQRWRRIHVLVYPAVVLAGVHYVLLSKGFQTTPLFYMATILVLLLTRLRFRNRRVSGV